MGGGGGAGSGGLQQTSDTKGEGRGGARGVCNRQAALKRDRRRGLQQICGIEEEGEGGGCNRHAASRKKGRTGAWGNIPG